MLCVDVIMRGWILDGFLQSKMTHTEEINFLTQVFLGLGSLTQSFPKHVGLNDEEGAKVIAGNGGDGAMEGLAEEDGTGVTGVGAGVVCTW